MIFSSKNDNFIFLYFLGENQEEQKVKLKVKTFIVPYVGQHFA